MSAPDALVVFTPSGRRGRFPLGSSLLQAARSLGVDIDSVCGGRGICGRCQVLVAEGEFSKHGVTSSVDNLSPVSAVEVEYCATQPMAAGRRLSCSAQVLGDLVIDVPPRRSTLSLTPWYACTTWKCKSPICTIRRAICVAWKTP